MFDNDYIRVDNGYYYTIERRKHMSELPQPMSDHEDAERYHWLKIVAEHVIRAVTWASSEAAKSNSRDVDTLVDLARKQYPNGPLPGYEDKRS